MKWGKKGAKIQIENELVEQRKMLLTTLTRLTTERNIVAMDGDIKGAWLRAITEFCAELDQPINFMRSNTFY